MAPRLDPDVMRAARKRMSTITGETGTDRAASRRTAARRAALSRVDGESIAALPDETILIASDPARLDQLALLAAAIDLAADIAPIIDRAGRQQIEDLLGADLRQHAVSLRQYAGPRQMLSGTALLQALKSESESARQLWCQMLPAAMRPEAPEGPTPSIPETVRNRLTAALGHAEAILSPQTDTTTPDKELAA